MGRVTLIGCASNACGPTADAAEIRIRGAWTTLTLDVTPTGKS
jgi:hypothetical protein